MCYFVCTSERCGGVVRTNIVLNEDLVAEAQRLTGLRTKRGLIDHALRELVRRRQQRRLLELRGRIKWEGNLGKMRQGRLKP